MTEQVVEVLHEVPAQVVRQFALVEERLAWLDISSSDSEPGPGDIAAAGGGGGTGRAPPGTGGAAPRSWVGCCGTGRESAQLLAHVFNGFQCKSCSVQICFV